MVSEDLPPEVAAAVGPALELPGRMAVVPRGDMGHTWVPQVEIDAESKGKKGSKKSDQGALAFTFSLS